jgi:activator of HSP90 ATPase
MVQKWKMRDWESTSDVIISFDGGDDVRISRLICVQDCCVSVKQTGIPNKDKHGTSIETHHLKQGWEENIFRKISKVFGYPVSNE